MSNYTTRSSNDDCGRPHLSLLRIAATIAAIPAAIVVVLVLIGALAAWDSTTAGQVAVVRNGGAFSNSNIRLVIQPASSLKWTGIWSNTHKYPATQRFYTITSDAGRGDRQNQLIDRMPESEAA